MKNSQKKELYRIAAELALCKNMPSSFLEDHPPFRLQQVCAKMGEKAENQCKQWAYKIRMVIEADK